MEHTHTTERGVRVMAAFMLNEREMVSIRATEISMEGDYISAWNEDKRVAIFRASEVIGCWLETGGISDGKVY